MPKTNQPYDPQPERSDALGELAREGYQAVPGDHAARLQSLHDRLGLPNEAAPATDAVVRTMRPRRWLAVAAGIAALLVAGIALYTYDVPEQQVARVMSQVEELNQPEATVSASDTADPEGVEDVNFNDVQEQVASDFVAVKTGDVNETIEAHSPSTKNSDPSGDLELHSDLLVEESSSAVPLPTTAAQAPPVVPKRKAAPSKSQAAEDQVITSQPSPVSSEPEAVSAPPSANSINNSKKAAEEDAGMLADKAESAKMDESASSYRMERAEAVQLRKVTGEVVEPSGVPIVGAVIRIEETGQQVMTDLKGEFSIVVTDEAVVGEIQAEGYSEFLFDVTAGEEYRIFLPRVSSSLPSAQLKGKDISLRILAPKAEAYPSFDEFIATKRSKFSGEKVIVQFDVNRFGRPRQIMSGPGKQNRDAVKEVKEWLKNGPDWPETYQRKSWRYEIELR